jgi:hypothetical protein
VVEVNRNTVKYDREFLFTDFHGRLSESKGKDKGAVLRVDCTYT